jgi:UDP-N-acetylglucosamine 2-epimerase
LEYHRATQTLNALLAAGLPHIVIIYPNNDPGHRGILRAYSALSTQHSALTLLPNVSRPHYLALLRDAAMLVGNSSSGLIEAASFHTPVLDLGPRQQGRQHSDNLIHLPYGYAPLRRAAAKIWNNGTPLRPRVKNIYGGANTGRKIAHILATIPLDDRLRRKLIAF